MRKTVLLLFCTLLLLFAAAAVRERPLTAQEDGRQAPPSPAAYRQAFAAERLPTQPLTAVADAACVAGRAAGYPCRNVRLDAFLPLGDLGGAQGNDIWGWTDPANGREYALMGLTNGVAFVDVTVPTQPRYLGRLPTHTQDSIWRDVKVYADHAFVVSEASGHGMQVFDLRQLRAAGATPSTFTETSHYDAFGNAHNIVINEESGFAYAVGSDTCAGGLHMIDVRTPARPTFAGCFGDDGYTHDAQCVIYRGPDAAFQGREICFNANADTLTIVDVSNKSKPVQLARRTYEGQAYTHQGWLTADHALFLLDDELDEQRSGRNTRTYVWDVADLTAPEVIDVYEAAVAAVDHNLYVHDGRVYQANYRSGLRVLDLTADGRLSEIGYFDIYPRDDNPNFNGAWSVYPYFPSGTIVVSGIEQGLYVLALESLSAPSPTPTASPTATPTATATPDFPTRPNPPRAFLPLTVGN